MDTKLRKRLEEAAEIKAGCKTGLCHETSEYCKKMCFKYRYAFNCIELGYKEAITMAIDWLEDTLIHYDSINGVRFVTDFEADMNKLWEEEK